ncbi:uncharacterized protein LOC127278704 isoform X2 [Leptopilina boulardi]|uniref:uncharacterized protein LOC127278704 isoform X2 n=1 Tax=Leptopilina boulardi TaxID=63433 RepID=UPI0021F5F1AC|nr:uncharacterized protein LOC127278704 isoform X2 [Leptopilina boulardi]
MQFSRKLNFFLLICCSFCIKVDSDTERLLSRKKRYVVFPEGSSFSGLNWGISYDLPNESKPELEPALALRKDKFKINNKINKIPMGEKNNYYKYGNWNADGKYYVLPNYKKYYKHNYHYLQRRHRRDLYDKLEVIMRAMGFDGRSCVLRALCEASQRLMPKGNTLVEEMMRIAFSLPLRKVFSFEPDEHHTYTNAHKAGHEGQNCLAMFPGCTFSLIDMALGKYNTPEDPPYNPDASERVTETSDRRRAPAKERYNMK